MILISRGYVVWVMVWKNKGKFLKILKKTNPKCRARPTRFGISVGDSCVCAGEAARAGCPLSGVRGPIRCSVELSAAEDRRLYSPESARDQ